MIEHDGRQIRQIAGVLITELIEQHAAPTYVYDAQMIHKRCDDLKSFDTVRFAQKACSNLSILSLIRKKGVLVDSVSAGEILRAKVAGYSTTSQSSNGQSSNNQPPEIVYTSDIFDAQALQAVAKDNVYCNLGSPDMIQQLAKICPGTEATLRINPGFGHGHSQKTNTGGPQSKHGIWHTDLPQVLNQCEAAGIKVTGLHMHIGSGTDLEHLGQVCQAMDVCARQVGPSIHTISCGGGVPTIYKDGEQPIDLEKYYRLWDKTRKGLQQAFDHPVALEIEPGRYLTAESGYLVTEIRAIKQMGENLFYLVDAGFNNLARPILYGAYHPMAVCSHDGRALDETVDVIVGGPLCESGDIFTQEEGGLVSKRKLPKATVGDYLVIGCAGAYGYVMSSNYNSKPMAAEVLIENGTVKLARKRQDLAAIFQDELAGIA